MSAVPVNLATTLAGGELFSGIALSLTAQMFWEHGVHFDIFNDRKRQTIMNFICLICAINTTISYGFNATKASVVVSDVTTVITFVSVQFSLVILNHNTIVRALNLARINTISGRSKDKFALVLYVVPFAVLVPMYLSFVERAGTGTAMNTSWYNAKIFKPLNIALVVATEAFATVTDILLLMKLRASRAQLSAHPAPTPTTPAADGAGQEKTLTAGGAPARPGNIGSQSLWVTYAVVWFLIIADVTVKALIAAGVPVLFDSIITVVTFAMRGRANLQYGLELQSVRQVSVRQGTSRSSRALV